MGKSLSIQELLYSFNGQSLTTGGIYRDTLSTVNGCDSFVVLTLTVNPIYTTPINAQICQGSAYSFNGQSLTTGGIYRDTLSTVNGCDSFVVLTLAVNPTYTTPISVHICQGSSYSFNGQSLTTGGIYRDTLSTVNGCDSFVVLTLTVNQTFSTPTSAHICQGSSYNFNGQSLTTGGIYRDTLSTVNGCDSFVVLTLTVNPVPVVNLGNDTTICSGNIVTLNAGNTGSDFHWSYNSTAQILDVSSTGTYGVTVTNSSNCSASAIINVNVQQAPLVNLGNDLTTCGDNVIELLAGNAGSTFQWSNGSQNGYIKVSNSGTYSVTVTDSLGCTGTGSIGLTFKAIPVIPALNFATICNAGSVTLNAGNAGSGFLWNDSSVGQTLVVSTAGNYQVTVTDTSGCSAIGTFMVSGETLSVNLNSNVTFCPGDSATLDAGNTGSTYQWSDNSTNRAITTTTPGVYSVTVTSSSGCTATGHSSLTLVSPGPALLELSPHIICSNVAARDLSGGSPAGGIYSGSSVSSGVFYPAVVGPGKYPITYTISDSGCSASAVDTITVNDCTGLSDITNPMEVNVYPNPNEGNFELLMLNSYLNDFNIEVVDIDGRIITQMEHERADAEYIKTFNLSDIAKGVYFVRVITYQEIIVRRVVIQ